jgi:hypothetical protein
MVVAEHVPHEDPDLAVVDFAAVAAPLALHPTECVPRFGKLLGSKAITPSGSPN